MTDWTPPTPEYDRPDFDEGDEVLLRAKVYRANGEQALIEFRSMEGPFSVRVPLTELEHVYPPGRPSGGAS